MANKEERTKSSFKVKNVLNWFGKLLYRSNDTNTAKNVSSADVACVEIVNREPVVQKEVLIHLPTADDESRSKGNDNSETSQKDSQEKENKDSSELVEREIVTQENIIKTVETRVERQSAGTRVEKSDSAEGLGNRQYADPWNSPTHCKFKTKSGLWICQVCSWSSPDNNFESLLDHCRTSSHREQLKGRFQSQQALGDLYRCRLSDVKNKTVELKGNSQFEIWSETNKKEDTSIVKYAGKWQMNPEQQKQSKTCNSEKPRTEMVCGSQQAQNRVCQESSRQEGLLSRMEDLLKEGLSVEKGLTITAVAHVPENETQSEKRINEMNPEVCSFVDKCLEIVKEEKGAEIKMNRRKRAKKKNICDTSKEKTDSKVSTSETNSVCKGGGGERNSQGEDILRVAEMKEWISALGIIFIEPVSVVFLRCIVCQKLLPAGSDLKTFVVNVGIHIEGKPHATKITRALEASDVVVGLMKKVQKSPTGSTPNLSENVFQIKKGVN